MMGCYPIKTWSSTQTSIALSSGEAEFNGVVRGSGVGLGYQSLLRDLGVNAPLRVWTDSSAALGICSRQGLGGVRHLDTHTLWVQQAVRCKRVDLRKIDGDVNPADVFTKHAITRDRLGKLMKLFECDFRGGRAQSAPKMRTGAGTRTELAEANAVDKDEHDGLPDPIMPHRCYDDDQLNIIYPPLTVPNDDDHDYEVDQEDGPLSAGRRIAEGIAEAARRHGRKKRVEES